MASIIASDTISDYVRVTGGIKLINKGKNYKYIYAITYHLQIQLKKMTELSYQMVQQLVR